jgi:hypothetical protein
LPPAVNEQSLATAAGVVLCKSWHGATQQPYAKVLETLYVMQ